MRRYRKAALLLGLMLIAAACGGDDGAEGGAGEGNGGGTEGLRVAYASDLDPNDISDQFGIQAAGAEVVELNEDSAVIAGLIRGDVDVGNIGLTEAIKAVTDRRSDQVVLCLTEAFRVRDGLPGGNQDL